ncbi:MAG: ABC transporter permease [Nitriliruptoraceae bacterium]
MRTALIILGKDLRLRMRDRSVLLFAIVVPLGLTFVFANIFAGADDVQFTAIVVDADGGPAAQGFVTDVVPALREAGIIELQPADSSSEARALVEDGTAAIAWLIPEGFSDRVTSGAGGTITVVANPDRVIATEIARNVAATYAGELNRIALAVATTVTAAQQPPWAIEATQLPGIADEAAASAIATGATIVTRTNETSSRQLDPRSYLAAGMAVFFLFFSVQFGITGMLEERDFNTLPRLLAAPISRAAIHTGKAAGAFTVGAVSMTLLAVASHTLLGANWGPPLGIAIMVFAAIIAAMGIMVLVGAFAKTSEQAGNLQSIVALTLGLAGGVFFPISTGWLANLSLLSPHAWFLRGLGDIVGTGSALAAVPAAGALLGVGAVTALLGAMRIRQVQP